MCEMLDACGQRGVLWLFDHELEREPIANISFLTPQSCFLYSFLKALNPEQIHLVAFRATVPQVWIMQT